MSYDHYWQSYDHYWQSTDSLLAARLRYHGHYHQLLGMDNGYVGM